MYEYYKFKIDIVSYIIVIQMVRVMAEWQGEQEKNHSNRVICNRKNMNLWQLLIVVNTKTMTVFFTKLIVTIALFLTEKKCRQ